MEDLGINALMRILDKTDDVDEEERIVEIIILRGLLDYNMDYSLLAAIKPIKDCVNLLERNMDDKFSLRIFNDAKSYFKIVLDEPKYDYEYSEKTGSHRATIIGKIGSVEIDLVLHNALSSLFVEQRIGDTLISELRFDLDEVEMSLFFDEIKAKLKN